jgi:hypothetical protein
MTEAASARDAALADAGAVADEMSALKAEVARLTRQVTEREKGNASTEDTLRVRTAELEREEQAHAETKKRLLVARDEIRRAEGQITLIQDLLLRQTEF